jgi:hypothetical protein
MPAVLVTWSVDGARLHISVRLTAVDHRDPHRISAGPILFAYTVGPETIVKTSDASHLYVRRRRARLPGRQRAVIVSAAHALRVGT